MRKYFEAPHAQRSISDRRNGRANYVYHIQRTWHENPIIVVLHLIQIVWKWPTCHCCGLASMSTFNELTVSWVASHQNWTSHLFGISNWNPWRTCCVTGCYYFDSRTGDNTKTVGLGVSFGEVDKDLLLQLGPVWNETVTGDPITRSGSEWLTFPGSRHRGEGGWLCAPVKSNDSDEWFGSALHVLFMNVSQNILIKKKRKKADKRQLTMTRVQLSSSVTRLTTNRYYLLACKQTCWNNVV